MRRAHIPTNPFFLVAAFAISAVTAPAVTPEQLAALAVRSPQPASTDYFAATANGSTVVAIGRSGTVVISQDRGTTWTAAPPIDDANGAGFPGTITNDGTRYVALSSNSFAVSTDLESWFTGRASGIGGADSAFGNSRFVSVGRSGTIARSLNGESWSPATTIPAATGDLTGVAFGNGTFAAAGSAGKLLRSTDGDSWTLELDGIPGVTGRESDFTDIGFAGGFFIAAGFGDLLYTSPDATTWTRRTVPSSVLDDEGGLANVAHDGTSYVFGTQFSGTLATTDFATFTNVPFESNGNAEALVSSGSAIIVAGRNSYLATFAPSSNTWIERYQRIGDSFNGVTFGNSLFVTADSFTGSIFTSRTGAVWTFAYQPQGTTNFRSPITFGNGRFVGMLGNDDFTTSTDGITWTEGAHGNNGTVDGITFLNDRFIVFGRRGTLFSSADTTTWTTHEIPEDFWPEAVAFGAGRYVLAGRQSGILSSTDFTTWTPHASAAPDSASFTGVTFAGGRFIAFETRGPEVSVSTDGTTWSREAIGGSFFSQGTSTGGGLGTDPDLGIYFIGSSNSVRHYSDPADLTTLTRSPIPGAGAIRGLAEGNGVTVIAGDAGLLLSTPGDAAGYDGWVILNFPLGSANTAPTEDFDSDGQANLIEYARGTDPTRFTPRFLAIPTRTAFGPEITWTQRTDAAGISSQASFSTDLKTWSAFGVAQETTPTGGGIEQVTARVTGEAGMATPIYLRIQWTLQ